MLSNLIIKSLDRMSAAMLRELQGDYLSAEQTDLAALAWVDAALSRKERRAIALTRPEEFWAL